MSEGGVDDNHRRRLTKKSCWDCAKRQVEIMRRAKRKPSRIKLCSRMVFKFKLHGSREIINKGQEATEEQQRGRELGRN